MSSSTDFDGGGGSGVDGLSAYQIWLGEGNVGTEQDFLDSLSSTYYSSILAPQLFNPDVGQVTADTGDFTLSSTNSVAFVSINGQVLDDSEHSLVGAVLTVFPDNGFNDITDELLVFQHSFLLPTTTTGPAGADGIDGIDGETYDDTVIQAQVDLNTAKIGVTTEIKPTDIDTLAELNVIITDATLIDTADARLSDARTPTAHTHVATDITDFDIEVSNNTSVAANTAKVTDLVHPLVETAVPVGAVFTDTIVGFSSSMKYLEDYTSQEYAGATDIATVYGIHPPFNSQMSFKRYKGKFDRTYYIYQAYVPNREGKIFWYDHDTNEYSATYKLSDTAPSQDTHHIYTINIIKDGRIQVISNYDDGVINVYTSTYPELDNNGAIDAAYTASVGAAAMTTHSNYVSSAYSNNKFILEWRGQANSSPTQEHRTLAVSEDNGQTFAANVEWLAFNNGMWAYGGMYPDHYRGGVFLTVARQNNSLGVYNGWGVLWTKDFITFGNMEYYATNGVSGISKNVVGTGAITQAEFEASYVVIDDGSGSNRQHYVPLLYQLGNGDIITHTCDGIRSGGNIISDYVTSHFSIETKAWVHKYAAFTTDFDITMDSADAPLVNVGLVPMDNLSMYMTAKAQDDAGYLFKTTDGGDTWTMVEQVVSLANAMATAPFAHADKSTSIVIHDYQVGVTNEIKILRFEEQLLSSTYSTQGEEFIDYEVITAALAGNYTVLTTDSLILKTAITTGGDTVTLPSNAYSGQPFTIKDASGNAATDNITIATTGAETIDGSATFVINGNYDGITVIFDGANYYVINKA